ncbi:NACHT, LRR and PYD domains-containing protein 12-like [Carassius auratus]|uniref:NACHT, LRR and PYD domains-containing protein 12-like n=1 Tax=Carassius auratus TaxID=7957 RepID=A0A6P6QWI8_CARAU|nr:NACHT, LRR and PYD domains-containing protein 12-like [Carassius auratus]
MDLSSAVSINEYDSQESAYTQCKIQLQMKLTKKCKFLHEGTEQQGSPTLLNEIYTELYITDAKEITEECEIRQIEMAALKLVTEDRSINCNDIFTLLPGQNQPIRTVLTKGFAGIGKTVSVQKFILDWAEGKANQDVHFIFPLPFRELNLINDKKLSLLDLLQVFFPETKEIDIFSDKYKVLFIFDGLDECRFLLDFPSNENLQDVNKETSVDVLLTNLIVGNLLPSALIWITSRPAATDLIPSDCVHRVTVVRGFNDPQKLQYFRKRISDQILAEKIISHLKSSRSLYIMCHIPVFCWISSTVLEKMLSQAESGEIPKTLTQMFTHFLIIQIRIKHEKHYEKYLKDEDMILKLAKLAYQQLVKCSAIFYEEDLRECGIDVTEASVYSGLCTQIFREEFGLDSGKIYCFVHLSIQEHLAAMYVHHTFTTQNCNVLHQITEPSQEGTYTQIPIFDLHQKAVDQTLQNKNRHLGLFLRFLLGFSLYCNQTLLKVLLSQTEPTSHNLEKTVEYIKKKIEENPDPDKFISLFHCLNDLGDSSLVEQIQRYLNRRALTTAKLTTLQWSAVVFVLLTSENLDVFELKAFAWKTNCARMVRVLRHLVPVVKASKSVRLAHCGLTPKCCHPLAEALASESSCLMEMKLNGNELKDAGVKMLSEGLGNLNCKLQNLGLNDCGVTGEGCVALASAIISNPLHLRELDLSFNELGDIGVQCLSDGLKNPLCKLEKLKLRKCHVTGEGCAALDSALASNPSHLRELDLTKNNVRDVGVNWLSVTLMNPKCQLKILRLMECGVTDESCAALASALRSNPSHLKVLDLSGNKLGDSGIKLLSKGPKYPAIGLEQLWLTGCGITHKGCGALTLALTSNLSELKELNLSNNLIGDSGLKLFSEVLQSHHCKLQTLGLNDCGITDEGCEALISALTLNLSNLSKLHLSGNKIEKSTEDRLLALRGHPDNKLKKVNLSNCRSESYSEY